MQEKLEKLRNIISGFTANFAVLQPTLLLTYFMKSFYEYFHVVKKKSKDKLEANFKK